jgi:CubicO group peptidase (beta-lactamase class C family)
VTHRSGLPRHEKMWYGSPYDRAELIHRLRYLQPNTDFRTTFHYQNMMFVTAGYLIGQVAGTTWEDFTQKRILDPLNMSSSIMTLSASVLTPLTAQPYLKPKVGDGGLQKLPFYNNDICAPAGAIFSSLNDMVKWVRLQLNQGKLDDDQFISESNLKAMHTPQTLIHDPVFNALYGEDFYAYGMGWFMHPYRGRTLIRHGGAIDGFTAQVGFIPKDQLGVIIFANMNETVLPSIALFSIIDQMLNLNLLEWDAMFKTHVSKADDTVSKQRATSDAERIPNTSPSHSLEAYTGAYEHAGYGVLRIELTQDETALRVQYNGLPSEVTHYHYDIFELYNELYEDNRWIKLRFQTAVDGSIESIIAQMELTAGIDPIVFQRKTDKGK